MAAPVTPAAAGGTAATGGATAPPRGGGGGPTLLARLAGVPPKSPADPVSPFDGMYFNHQAMRRDFLLVQRALDAADAAVLWHMTQLADYLSLHAECIHGHHTIEDDYFFPFMSKYMTVPRQLTDDHGAIVASIGKLERLTRSLQRRAGANGSGAAAALAERTAALTALRLLWPAYAAEVEAHLELEEAAVWPVLLSQVTGKAMKELGRRILNEAIPKEMKTARFKTGVRFGWMLSADLEHADDFLKQLPPPPVFLYKHFWEPAWSAGLARALPSIIDPTEPRPAEPGGCCAVA